MPPIPLPRRRDPFWGDDGRAARRRRLRNRLVAALAFVIALAAVTGAAFGWALQLGLAGTFGLPLDLFVLVLRAS